MWAKVSSNMEREKGVPDSSKSDVVLGVNGGVFVWRMLCFGSFAGQTKGVYPRAGPHFLEEIHGYNQCRDCALGFVSPPCLNRHCRTSNKRLASCWFSFLTLAECSVHFRQFRISA